MPFPVQDQRFARAIRRLFSLQGHLGAQAIDDVFPMVDLLSRSADRFADREETLFAYTGTVTAAAGQFPTIALWNDSAEYLVVLDRVDVGGSSASFQGRSASGDPGAGTPGVVSRCDTRLTGAFAWLVVRQISAVALGGASLFNVAVPIGDTYPLEFPYVLGPDQVFVVESNTAGSTMRVSGRGWWRRVTPGDTLG